tara:strand:- start:1189 stop:1392 length:204 start_codon:yes stop_codon:yes gene_type:complete
MSNKTDAIATTSGISLLVAVIIIPIAAWFTHVVVCIQASEWFLLIAGAIMFPIAIVHGIGVWFGVWA